MEIPPAEDEKIVNNNQRDLQVEVEETRLPVLYIEGSPRTEFRFLRGALFEDILWYLARALHRGPRDLADERRVRRNSLIELKIPE